MDELPFDKLFKKIIDNRGKTCPTSDDGFPLIATNCIKTNQLYPVFENIRYVDDNIKRTWFRAHPKPGNIIFVTKGTPGRTAIVPDPVNFCIAQDMVALDVDENVIDTKYLFAVLRSKLIQAEIENLHVGSLIPHFKKGDFGRLSIPIPDKYIQAYIGNLYYDISLKIDLLYRNNKTLEQLAETLFRHWFGEIAVVNTKEVQLREYVDVLRGLSYKGSGLTNQSDNLGIPMINLNSVFEGGGFKEQGTKYYNGEYSEKHRIFTGDIIVTNTEQGHEHKLIGYSAIIPRYIGSKAIFSQHIYRIVPKIDSLTPLFLHHLFKLPYMREQLVAGTNGSTVNMLPSDSILRCNVRIPFGAQMEKFNTLVSGYQGKQESNIMQIKKLESIREMLLPKLLNGIVKIKHSL